MHDRELLWRQHQLAVDMYKEYLGLVIKTGFFYYAITAAILLFYFANRDVLGKQVLLLPFLMSVMLGAIFAAGAWLAAFNRKDDLEIQDALGLKVAPEIGVLILLLSILAVLMFIAAGSFACFLW